jgi:zinc transporter ZupT
LLIFCAPLLLLGVVIAVFVLTHGAGLNIQPAAPIETVQFGRTLLRPGQIELRLRNTSPDPIHISQVNINDAIWPHTIFPSRTIPRLGNAVITLNYHWVEGEAYEITIFSGSAVPFATSIAVATATPTVSASTLWSFTLIGVYVGIIPVLLGMFWLPTLRGLGRRAMLFLMSATVGLLVYLGIDATTEALESGATLGGALQGIGIVAIGISGTVLLLDSISRRQTRIASTGSDQRMTLATMIAIGIGLHNLGEGLAIGAAYAVGAAALGTFLVVGFILQNITEGLGIIVPISREHPKLRDLALLGLIGGAPAILGTWVGGLTDSLPLTVFFLAVGAGAVFQVAYEIGRQLVWNDSAKNEMPLTAFSGVLTGMLVLYITGLAIK